MNEKVKECTGYLILFSAVVGVGLTTLGPFLSMENREDVTSLITRKADTVIYSTSPIGTFPQAAGSSVAVANVGEFTIGRANGYL